jgi:long-subunit acyl-CoA synthetase (AMP-forming)
MAHQLRDSTAQTIFVQPALLPTLHKALELPDMPTFSDDRIILLCQLEDKPKDAERYKSIEEIMGSPLKPKRFMTYEETRTAFLCYSSGTTGLAKGVETSHHNMTSQIQALNIAYTRLSHGTDVSLGILPFGHIYGLTVGLVSETSLQRVTIANEFSSNP